jgi:hypothetical protein
MSRYVKPVQRGMGKQYGGGIGETQEWLKRVASYIPAEVTAFYAAGVGAATVENDAPSRIKGEAVVFLVALIFAGFPLWREGGNDPPRYRRIQIGIATLSFLAWAYALNSGLVAEFHLYHMVYALSALFAVSCLAGLYKPKMPAPGPTPPAPPPAAAS